MSPLVRLRSLLPLSVLGRPRIAAGTLAVVFALIGIRRAAEPVGDPDVFWLGAVGRDFVLHGVVPRMNHYSYSAPDHPWINHEWGFAAIYGAGMNALGPAFCALFALACATLTAVVTCTYAMRRARRLAAGALVALFALCASASAWFEPRPAYASLVLPVALVSVAFGRRFTWLHGAAAVSIVLLWTQLHGSFVLGIVILGLSAFTEEGRPARIFAAVVACAVTVVNPYGFELHRLVARYVLGYDPTAALLLANLKEFAPIWGAEPPYRNAFDYTMLSIVAITSVAALFSATTRRRGAVAMVLVLAAVWQVRHLTMAVLIGPMLLVDVVDRWLEGDPRAELSGRPSTLATLLAMGAASLLSLGVWGRAYLLRASDEWIAGNLGGAEVASLVRSIPDDSRVWAPFQTSALVIWVGAPRGVRVYYDSRNDCYPEEVARTAWEIGSRDKSGNPVLHTIASTSADVIVVPVDGSVATAARSGPCWQQTHRFGRWAAHRRREGCVE